MIENERQLQITKEKISEFENLLRYIDHILSSAPDPRLLQARREAIESVLTELREEVAAWELEQDVSK
jgi:hypothetical protein